jgi:hypothetical protein
VHCPFSQSGSGGLRCELEWWAREALLSHCSASWRQKRAGGTKETLQLQTRAEMGYKEWDVVTCASLAKDFIACFSHAQRSSLIDYRLSLKPPTGKDSESVFYYFVYALFFSHT